MDQHPIKRDLVILLVTSCWVSCDGLASHQGGFSYTPSHFMLGILWWTSIPSRRSYVVILLVKLCWVPCDELESHPGGSSDTPSLFVLGSLWWTSSTPSNGPVSDPGKVLLLLVILCWVSCDRLVSHPGEGGGVVMLLVILYWIFCDRLASHPGETSNAPSHFMLGILWWPRIPSRGE